MHARVKPDSTAVHPPPPLTLALNQALLKQTGTASGRGSYSVLPVLVVAAAVAAISMAAALAGKSQTMSATPILYTYPLAYAPGKAVLALAEKGVTYTPRVIDLFNGQSLSPEYLKLNPHGTVPTLNDGGKLFPDSKEIVDYINNKDGQPLGGDKVDQKLAADWATKIHAWDGNLFVVAADPGTAKVLAGLQEYKIKYAEARAKQYPELADTYAQKIESIKQATANGRDKAKTEANLQQLASLLDEAEQQLGKTRYLAGEEYSVADIMFTPVLFRLSVPGKTGEYLKPRPKVSEYFNRMKERPSFAKAFGPAQSKLTGASLLLPALVRAKVAQFTGWY